MARILIVEDDPDVKEMAEWTLSHWGHKVVSARNGKEALAVLKDGAEIDLLLTDVIMPEMDGVTLCQRLGDIRPSLPIIFISGHVRGLNLPEGRQTVFLQKPYRTNALLAAIEKLVGPTGEDA